MFLLCSFHCFNFPLRTHPNLYSVLNIPLTFFLLRSQKRSIWSISKVIFLFSSYWTLRSFWDLITSSLKHSFVSAFPFIFFSSLLCTAAQPSLHCWLFLITLLLNVELHSCLFFTYSLLDELIHSHGFKCHLLSCKHLLFPCLPITGNVAYLVRRVRLFGITLHPFLLLILHIKSISSAICSMFKTHLDLPNLLHLCFSSIVKGILISHLDDLSGLLTVLQFSVLHLLPLPLDPNPLSFTLSKWWMNGWRNDHDKCLSVSFASLLLQGSKKSHLFFLLQLYKKLAPHFTSLLTLWDFFGGNYAEAEIPVLWPPHVKSWLIGKDSDAGRDWGQEEKGTTEDEMGWWHHWLYGHESQWTLGVGDGPGGLACCDSWGRKESDTTERLNWTEPYENIPSSFLPQSLFTCTFFFLKHHLIP